MVNYSTKPANTSHLNSLNTKTTTDDVGNTSPSLGQAQKGGRVKPGIKLVNDQQ